MGFFEDLAARVSLNAWHHHGHLQLNNNNDPQHDGDGDDPTSAPQESDVDPDSDPDSDDTKSGDVEATDQHGGIGPSVRTSYGAQNAPTHGDTLQSDFTRRRRLGSEESDIMEEENISQERRGSAEVDVGQEPITVEDAPADGGELVATTTAEEKVASDRQERLRSVDLGDQANIESEEKEGRSEEVQDDGLSQPHVAVPPGIPTPALAMGTATSMDALPPHGSVDHVQIVDDDAPSVAQPDAPIDALLQQAEGLQLKTDLPAPDLPIPSLAPPFELDTGMAPLDPLPYTSGDLTEPYTEQPAPVQPATGFAKLEFQDGHFYMTTYAVELGRDMRAYRVAQQYQARMTFKHDRPTAGAKRSQRSASVPGTPARPIKNDNAGMSARSFLSESGGIVGEDDGHIKLKRRKKKKSGQSNTKSKSTDTSSSHSHSMSRKNSIVNQPLQNAKFDYNLAAAMQTVDPNATAPLDPMVHMPDPHFTPLIPVHPPMNSEEEFVTGKGISRKHVRISYNFDRCHFEMAVYGRNGAFHNDQHHQAGSTVPLHDGSMIQIGGVSLRFVLPTLALEATDHGETDFDSVSGRMSFNFEDAHGESIVADDEELEEFSSPSARARAHAEDYEDYGYDEELLDEDDEGDEDDDEEEESEESEEEETPKKRGPGRPRVHDKKPPPKSKDKYASKTTESTSRKAPTKLTLKLNQKDKAREKERLRLKAEAEERERQRAEAKAKAAKLKAKQEAAKAKAKAQVQAQAEAEAREKAKKAKEKEAEEAKAKQFAEKNTPVNIKEESKEPSKTPAGVAGDPSSSKEPSAPRIARDAPMQNGEDINVPGLPAGIIIPARKKGPGRPPKDGVMSKRERAQLIKQAKEREKAIKLGLDPSLIPAMDPRPPSKPKPRRNSQGEEIDDPPGDGDERPKVPRPPRSPSPEMRIEDYSEEQLQRPSANYVYLIFEAIKNSKAGVMNLQQIYSAIERKYPWYKFKAGSNGWQSSVRHNLGQHEAFKKVEKEGKGWLWGIKEGVPIERERKKKSPPPQPHPSFGNGYPPYPQYGGNAQYPPYPPGQPGQYQQRSTNAPPPNGQRPQNAPPPPNGQYPPNYQNNGNNNQRPPYRPPPPHYQNQPKRYKPPSNEVIDTFKKVFISTYAARNDNNTAKAEAIVTNAIKRVLEPETMVGVPKDGQEENVMRAFEGILVQSQGPPRSLGGGSQRPPQGQPQQGMQRPPPAQAGVLPPGHQGPQPQGYQGPPPQGQQGASPNGQQGPLPQGQTTHGVRNPSTVPPGQQPPHAQGTPSQGPAPGLTNLQAPIAAHPPSTSPPAHIPSQQAANAASHVASIPIPTSLPQETGTPQPHSHPTQQQAHSLTAPRAQGPAEQSLFGMLIGGPAAPATARSNSNTPIPGSGRQPAPPANPTQSASPAPAQPTTTHTHPPLSHAAQAAAQGLGLNLNIGGGSVVQASAVPRTMTPTRPAVEPLTPPAVASPKVAAPAPASVPATGPVQTAAAAAAATMPGSVNVAHLADVLPTTASSIEAPGEGQGTKRARSPSPPRPAGETGGGEAVKKVKIDKEPQT